MAKLSEYQQLRRAGMCTRNCGRKGSLKNPKAAASKSNMRQSECKQCRERSHGKK